MAEPEQPAALYSVAISWSCNDPQWQRLIKIDPKCSIDDINKPSEHNNVVLTKPGQDSGRSCAFNLAAKPNHELNISQIITKGSLKAVEFFKNDSNYIGTFKPCDQERPAVVTIPVDNKLSKLTLNLIPLDRERLELDCICICGEITTVSVDEIRAREAASSAKVTQMLMMALSKGGPTAGSMPGMPPLPAMMAASPAPLPAPVSTPPAAQIQLSTPTAASAAPNVALMISSMQQSILGAIDQLRTDVTTRLERIEARLTALESVATLPAAKD